MHIEPEAARHGQSLGKEGDLGTGLMARPGFTHQDLLGQVQSSFLRKTLQQEDSCAGLADFLFSKSFDVSPAERSETLQSRLHLVCLSRGLRAMLKAKASQQVSHDGHGDTWARYRVQRCRRDHRAVPYRCFSGWKESAPSVHQVCHACTENEPYS